jgi:hypothetical protein
MEGTASMIVDAIIRRDLLSELKLTLEEREESIGLMDEILRVEEERPLVQIQAVPLESFETLEIVFAHVFWITELLCDGSPLSRFRLMLRMLRIVAEGSRRVKMTLTLSMLRIWVELE